METEILQNIGLTPAEIKVYLSLLEIGSAVAGQIIKKTKLQSSVVHKALNSLIEKGLVNFVVKANIRHYQATDPRNILDFIEDKKKQFKDLLPELIAKQQIAKEKHTATVYKGVKGIKTAFNDLIKDLRRGTVYRAFVVEEQLQNEEIVKFFKQLDIKRLERGVKTKLIANKKAKSFFKKKYKEVKTAIFRFTSLHIPAGMSISGNKLMIVTWEKEPTAFVMVSSELVKRYIQFFDSIWAGAEK